MAQQGHPTSGWLGTPSLPPLPDYTLVLMKDWLPLPPSMSITHPFSRSLSWMESRGYDAPVPDYFHSTEEDTSPNRKWPTVATLLISMVRPIFPCHLEFLHPKGGGSTFPSASVAQTVYQSVTLLNVPQLSPHTCSNGFHSHHCFIDEETEA